MPLNRLRRIARRTLILTPVLCAGLASGCIGSRTVLVNQDSPIRVGPNVKGRVYTMVPGEWVLGDNPVWIQEGWYLVPPSYVHPTTQPG